MPTYEVVSERTGKVHEFDSDNELTDDQIASVVSDLDGSTPRTITPARGEGVLRGDPVFKDLGEAVPFVGASNELDAGIRSGNQLLGDNFAGDALGYLLGGARAAGTAFNPVGKIISAVPKYAGAVGSAAGGDLDAALRNITGSEAVSSAIQIPALDSGIAALDVPVNTLGNISQEVVNQPLLLSAALPGALESQIRAVRNFPSNVASIPSSVASTPIAQGVSGALKGTGRLAVGTVKAIGKSVLPKTVESEFVTALSPGSNPVQVQKAIQAVKTVIPNAQDVINRSGSTFDTAAGARDVSAFAKNDIWAGIEQQTGQKILADANPIAEAYFKVAQDPAISRLFPEAIPQLMTEAQKFLDKRIPVQELESIKQTFNAINQTKEAITKSKKAALLKSDPVYAASDAANEAIGLILEDTFGPEFTQAKQQWGAWKQINDLANKQAIRQEILDNKVTPFEGLGILGAVAQGVAAEGSLFRGMGTAVAGKALKYANSPDAAFSKVASKIEKQ